MSAVSLAYIEKKAALLPEDEQWDLVTWARSLFAHLEPEGGGSVWRHVGVPQLSYTSAFVAGDGVKPLAAEYIGFAPEMQDSHMDWLIADSLCFAELNATMVHFRMMTGGKQAIPMGLRLAIFAWKAAVWLIWAAIMAAGFFLHPLVGWALIGLTGISLWSKLRASKARGQLMLEMIGTYQALASSTFSWAILWDHMARSRALGAVWPPELYRLVELRIHR